MKLLRGLQLGMLHRRTLRALERIDSHLAAQNIILARLADHFAPHYSEGDAPAQANVDYLNPHEAAAALSFIAKVEREQGRAPTDEELLRFLAEEATHDLQAQMEGR